MRNILLILSLLLLLFPSIYLDGEEIPEMPELISREIFSAKEWEDYTREVLRVVVPDLDTSDVKIWITTHSMPIAMGLGSIKISHGFLEIVESKYEYAATLVHELGHYRQGWKQHLGYMGNQVRADRYVLDYMPRRFAGGCALSTVVAKFVSRFEPLEPDGDKIDFGLLAHKIDEKRIESLRRRCWVNNGGF